MRDLTSRALDTATALGATYADVRVVRQLEEAITIKSGRLEGVAGGESEGFGVRVLVDGAWGFAASHSLSTAEADRVAAEAVRIARASATAIRRPVVLDDRPPAQGRFETPVVEDPFAVPLEQKLADLMAADEALRRVDGHRLDGVDVRRPARARRRSPPATARTPSRSSPTSARASRPTSSTATSTSAGATPTTAGCGRPRATSTSGRWTSRATPSASPSEARELIAAPPLPAGVAHDRPPPEPAVHAGPRELRPPDRARPRLRHRGELRRHELPHAGHAGLVPLRVGPVRHRRRRDRAGRPRELRLGRRGRRGPVRAAHQGGDVRRLPVAAARRRPGSAASRAGRCGPTAGTASR